MIREDISVGSDPILAMYDISTGEFIFSVDGRSVKFDMRSVPFTLVCAELNGGMRRCADKALILKHEENL